MLYVVHTIPDWKRHSFKTHGQAFAMFKQFSKRNVTVAMWRGNTNGSWDKLYASEWYPEKLTAPYLHDSNKKGGAA